MRQSDDPIRNGLLARLVQFLVLIAALGLFPADAVNAEGTAWARGRMDLVPCVARQQPGDHPQALFTTPARFDCRRSQSAWGPGNYWVRLDLPPGGAVELAPAAGCRNCASSHNGRAG